MRILLSLLFCKALSDERLKQRASGMEYSLSLMFGLLTVAAFEAADRGGSRVWAS